MLLSAKNILLHTYPFVFIDEYKIVDSNNIYGEVCFDDEKYSYNNVVDFCDLIEASGQLCGVHIAKNFNGSNGMAVSGYLSKIYQTQNFSKEVYPKHTKFTLEATFLDNLDNYFMYSIKVFNAKTAVLVLETKLGVMLSNSLSSNTTQQQQNNQFIGSDNDDIFSSFEQIDNLIHMSFSKKANFFEGHFNKYPVVPGIYLVKSACIALGKFHFKENNINSLRELNNCKFNSLIFPEDKVIMDIKTLKERSFAIKILASDGKQLKCGFSLTY